MQASFLELFSVAAGAPVVAILQEILTGTAQSFVLFRHGTVVFFQAITEDPARAARDVLARHGPVIPGTPAGDFTAHTLLDDRDYLVTGASPGMFTYVSRLQLASGAAHDMAIGYYGREQWDKDSRELDIVKVVELPAPHHA
jgi:hypothetical protein